MAPLLVLFIILVHPSICFLYGLPVTISLSLYLGLYTFCLDDTRAHTHIKHI